MPTYDYQCRSCGSTTEMIHSMLEDGPTVCELCGGGLRRVLYPTGIIFKGSGFYKTDSRSASSGSVTGSSTRGSNAPPSVDATAAGSGEGSPSSGTTAPSSDAGTGASDGSRP